MLIVAIIVWGFSALLAGAIAGSKGRSATGWFLLGLIVGPIATGLASIAAPLLPATDRAGRPTLKTCPDCQGVVPGIAKVCMHCGHRFAALAPPQPADTSNWSKKDREKYERQFIEDWGVSPSSVPPAPPPIPDMSRWSKRDREAWARKHGGDLSPGAK